MAAAVEWQASRYDRLANPHERWAGEILDRLLPSAGERVLDAGCGSGRVTKLLCERLKAASDGERWSVVAVDASQAMVEQARAALADYGDRVEIAEGDLLDLDLSRRSKDRREQRVDAVFSCAVFHWIADHRALFRRLFQALKPGGRLVAQCGGEGNVTEWEQAIRKAMTEPAFNDSFLGWAEPWNFAGPRQTEERLAAAGFADANCHLEEKVTEVDDARAYLEVVGLSAHLDHLPESLREPFVEAVLQRLREPNTLRYVRLNIEARRPADGVGLS